MTCIQELYASACLYTLRPGLFSRGGEHSGTCYHENTVKHNKAAGDWAVPGLNARSFFYFCSSCLTKNKSFLPVCCWGKQIDKRPLCFNRGCTVTSWLCGRSPGRGFRRCTSACTAGASWGTDAWKHWAGTWYRKGAGCCYWSRCGSRCPCRPQHCPDPRLSMRGHRQTAHGEETRGGMLYYVMWVNNSDAFFLFAVTEQKNAYI